MNELQRAFLRDAMEQYRDEYGTVRLTKEEAESLRAHYNRLETP